MIIVRKPTDPEKSTELTLPQVLTSIASNAVLWPTYQGLSYDAIREIRKDPTIQLARWAVLSPMIHTPWVYIKNGDATDEMLELIENNFKPLREDFLQRAVFGSLDYGWSPFEAVYNATDGQINLLRMKSLLQDYTFILIYEDTGSFAGFINSGYFTGLWQEIPDKYSHNATFEVEGTD